MPGSHFNQEALFLLKPRILPFFYRRGINDAGLGKDK